MKTFLMNTEFVRSLRFYRPKKKQLCVIQSPVFSVPFLFWLRLARAGKKITLQKFRQQKTIQQQLWM